jgi:hypothetical protein
MDVVSSGFSQSQNIARSSAMSPLDINRYPLYETDYLQWIETTVARLRRQDYEQVDWEPLIEEIEDLGRSERRALKSNLIIVLVHLLKWQYQPNHRSGSWEGNILEHRRRVREALQDSPSLQPYLQSFFGECYTQAVKQAKAETGLPLKIFPEQCPYHRADVLEDQFLPQ